jgi:Succinate dehydrogenase/fumarate reductase, flavoprotein subunit
MCIRDRSAIARNESRGAHFREDFDTRNDKEFLKAYNGLYE